MSAADGRALLARSQAADHNLGAPLVAREHLSARRSSAAISGVRAMPSEKIFRLCKSFSCTDSLMSSKLFGSQMLRRVANKH